MPGIIYLILNFLLGKEIAENVLFDKTDNLKMKYNRCWLLLPASYGVGTLVMTWPLYLLAWFFHACGAEHAMLFGNIVVMGLTAVLLAERYFRKKMKTEKLVTEKKLFIKELIFWCLILFFVSFTMFYVFHVKDGVLFSGFSVYGDYAPHTAMMRSFSRGNNFPTQYPHFGGEDVKYHFMFQFYTGNLEYMGLRIDFAYNIVSILSLTGFLMMLYLLAKRIMGRSWTGVLTVILFFFRSAWTIFRFLWEHFEAGDLWKTLAENTAFIGYTTNENWGLWNYNVYLNQRHLAYGLLLASIALWIFLDWAEAGNAHPQKGLCWLKDRLFTKEAWKSKNLETALAVGLLLGLCAFWNGAAVIGGLLILFGFAVFSDGKLDYAVTAAVTILFSFLQSKIFMNSSSMGIRFQWGFLAENKTFAGVLEYLFQMSGVFFLGAVILWIFCKRQSRVIMIGFLMPVLFAFTMSLTPDIAVNHKYVMIAYAFLTMFWADLIVKVWTRKHLWKAAAILLTILLTATGIYDFVIIMRNNGEGRRVGVNLNSDLTEWLVENTDEKDLILTAQYSMNEVTMSGRMLYSGWPYYAWSAGYDTYYRAEQAVMIFTSSDKEEIRNLVEQENITYIIFEEGMEYEQQICREDVIRTIYPVVYRTEDGRIRIYETE